MFDNVSLLFRGGRAFLSVVKDPNRLDQVFDLAETLSQRPDLIQQILEPLRQVPSAARAFQDRPRLGPVDLEALGRLPEGTLGRAYADFMRRNHLDPADLRVSEVQDDITFFRAHMAESHDLWHVVTGFDTDAAAEVGLQVFGLAQIPSRFPMAILLAGLANSFLYRFEDQGRLMQQVVRGWLLGQRARPLFGTDWKQLWETPLSEVRQALGLDVEAVESAVAARAPLGQRVRAAA